MKKKQKGEILSKRNQRVQFECGKLLLHRKPIERGEDSQSSRELNDNSVNKTIVVRVIRSGRIRNVNGGGVCVPVDGL